MMTQQISKGTSLVADFLDLGGHIGDKRDAVARVLAAQHPNDLVGCRGCHIALGALRLVAGAHTPMLRMGGMGCAKAFRTFGASRERFPG